MYLFVMKEMPPLKGDMKTFMDGLLATHYFMTLLKVTELVCGLALLSGFFVPLAIVILSPIIVNIAFVHTVMDPTGLPVAAFLVLGNAFLGFYYRDRFAPMLRAM